MTLPSSYHKANNYEDGPFRKVVDVVCHVVSKRPTEVLECGHQGQVLPAPDWGRPRKKRRCWECREGLERPPTEWIKTAERHPKAEFVEGRTS